MPVRTHEREDADRNRQGDDQSPMCIHPAVLRPVKEGRSYAVPFTLFVDASNPHEAFERAMQFRNILGTGDPNDVRSLPFYWHLHDVEGR
jgi:hypothetical protein